MKPKLALIGAAMACAVCVVGCQRFDHEAYERSLKSVKEAAQRYDEAKSPAQAYLLSRAYLDAEPGDAEAGAILQRAFAADPKLEKLDDKGLYGVNMRMRQRREDFPIAGRIALWPVNLVLEILELATAEAGVGVGAGVKVQVTEVVSAGAQVSLGETAFGVFQGDISTRGTIEEFFDLTALETRVLTEGRAYTGGAYALGYANAPIKKPSDRVFQRARDFWGVGGQAQAGVVSFNLKLHPLQLVDMFGAIFFLDPLNDDFVATRPIRLKADERDALARLAEQKEAQ